ncbi:MAG: dihydrofolate reductase family protein [Ignavibacteriales bacterium]|nr:dihydrofolate reductase family protein [Ignavibacteriales bacterium]
MRKVFLFNMISLDGFFEGPNQEIDWHNVDGEFNAFAEQQLKEADILLFGRVTYELMASYWPTESARTNDPIIANKMNAISKIVFSKTLETVTWNNTRLLKENITEEVTKLKHQPGKDIAVFGSSNLAVTFMQHGFIDEYRIMVNPVILGKGNTLFNGINDRFNLSLLKTKTFRSGNVLLYYQPVRKE